MKGETRKRHHSGFAQFPDEAKRDQFVNAVLAHDAVLIAHAYVSGSQSTVVFENLTDTEQEELVSALEGIGRWVEDVQFEPMEPTIPPPRTRRST